MVSTSRIERPPLYRGGSASIETIPATSPSSSQTARCTSTGDHSNYVSILITSPRGVSRLSFTARIEGPPYHRGASASKKDSLATPLSTRLNRRRAVPSRSVG